MYLRICVTPRKETRRRRSKVALLVNNFSCHGSCVSCHWTPNGERYFKAKFSCSLTYSNKIKGEKVNLVQARSEDLRRKISCRGDPFFLVIDNLRVRILLTGYNQNGGVQQHSIYWGTTTTDICAVIQRPRSPSPPLSSSDGFPPLPSQLSKIGHGEVARHRNCFRWDR